MIYKRPYLFSNHYENKPLKNHDVSNDKQPSQQLTRLIIVNAVVK